ncbi:hypothetical protein [Fulvivirga lutimaris]|uniref:hypothetical protein n=1 Tax=Fulvivirga lutimaris TaxID=1819566 RepID=UPI0012BCE4FD|nr:hypothetical protein [Fulvivirga lutimaris]MTI41326.1 hypothetical protein [Fulvivirga lutimaris]
MRIIILILTLLPSSSKLFAQISDDNWSKKPDSTLLSTYINTHLYGVLGYESKVSSLEEHQVKNDHNSTNTQVIIRDHSISSNPLIVINNHPLEKDKLTVKLYLIDVKEIKFHTSDEAYEIYGVRAKNGAILIEIDKRRFKKLWKNTEDNSASACL